MQVLKAYGLVGYTRNRVSETFTSHDDLDAWVDKMERDYKDNGGFQLWEVFKVEQPEPKKYTAPVAAPEFDNAAEYVAVPNDNLYLIHCTDTRIGNRVILYWKNGESYRTLRFYLRHGIQPNPADELRGDDLKAAILEYLETFYGVGTIERIETTLF